MIVPQKLRAVSGTPTVGKAVAWGTLIGTLTTGAIKILTFASQWVIAWYLAPQDLGLAAIALSVMGIAQLLQVGSGLYVVLVTRRGPILRAGSQAFYLGLAAGVAVALAISLLSPYVAGLYSDPRLVWLLCISSLAIPIDAFGLVQTAWLARHFRFGRINAVNLIQAGTRALGQIVLAAAGAGVYALIVPNLLAAITKVVGIRSVAPRIRIASPRPSEWSGLWQSAIMLNVNGFLTAMSQYGIVLVVTTRFSKSDAGLYFWGLTLAGQAIYLVSASLGGVFVPAYASLQSQPARQLLGFVRASFLISILLTPGCMLLAVLSRDLITVIFAERWLPAWQVVSLLSIGLVTQPVVGMSHSLLMAQKRYGMLVAANGILTLLVTSAGCVAFLRPSLPIVAGYHACAMILGAAIASSMVLAGTTRALKTTVKLVFLPLLLSLPASLAALGVNWLLSSPLLAIAVIPILFLTVYGLAVRWIAADAYEEIRQRLLSLVATLQRRGPAFA